VNVLAIGAHPDDIEFGCGGMLTKYAEKGHAVYLFVASDGALGGDGAVRRREQQDSALVIGAREVFWGDYQDTEIPLNRELIVRLEAVIRQIEPRMIFVNFPEDTHQDHRNLAQGTLSATRYVPNFLFYEGPTSVNFTPNCFTDIEKVLDKKLACLEAHRSQVAKTNIEDLSILELALAALGIGAGDEVLIPTYVCDALHHAVRRRGATPVLVDADPVTQSLSAKDALARRTRRTRAVIVPHAFGLVADLEPFQALEVPVIEDCAQALGARTPAGRPAGADGALAVCSFYATKMIAAGEGGAVAGPAALVARVREARDYDEQETLAPRTNAKFTDMAAALARGQLARLDAFVARRRALAARYRAALAGAPVRLPADAGPRHVYHRFVLGLDRDPAGVAAALAAHGVAARRPVFRPAHRALGLGGYPEADRLWGESLSIPCYPALTDDEAEHVGRALAAGLAASPPGAPSP